MKEKHRIIRDNTSDTLSSLGAGIVGMDDKEAHIREVSPGRDIWTENYIMNRY